MPQEKFSVKQLFYRALPFGLVLFFFWGIGVQIYPSCHWSQSPNLFLKVQVVNYTVPFDDYKEHRGLIWLLNHLKVIAPGERDTWQASTDYVGYDPRDRPHPRRLAEAQPLTAHLIYIADTYGVYRDDLKRIKERRAHMDYNPLLFGGLSKADAQVLERFTQRGGHLVAEFNSFCEPTPEPARRIMERLLGLRWTGWVGRLFVNPRDTDDVPWWLPREFAKQFPGVPYPSLPTLVFADRHGKLLTVTRADLEDLVPQIQLTPEGRERFPDAPGDAPYFFWFAVMEARGPTQVHAELVLPPSLQKEPALQAAGITSRFPLLTELRQSPSVRLYWAADIADIDFDPGPYERSDIIATRGGSIVTRRAVTAAPAYWRVYAPVMRALLKELSQAARTAAKR